VTIHQSTNLTIRSVGLSGIAILPQRRAVRPDAVDQLVASIRDIGLLNPITLRPREGGMGYYGPGFPAPGLYVIENIRGEYTRGDGWETDDSEDWEYDPPRAPTESERTNERSDRTKPGDASDGDGQPDEMQEWHDFDPDC
jgi:hypothetical protein